MAQQAFSLFAANGRVYARNPAQKVIDLGVLERRDGGWCYELDGNHHGGRSFSGPGQALHDIAAHLRFLWLDGQFTAVADARDDPSLNLDGATQLDILLDELAPGERAQDATV